MLIEELEVADDEVIISGRYVYDFVGANAFARHRRQHLDTHDPEQQGTNQSGAMRARPTRHRRR
jgi:hypothetical protein